MITPIRGCAGGVSGFSITTRPMLWELPWLKPSLDKYRFGRTWEERWELWPDVDPRHPSMRRDWRWEDDHLLDDPSPHWSAKPVRSAKPASERRSVGRPRTRPVQLRLLG